MSVYRFFTLIILAAGFGPVVSAQSMLSRTDYLLVDGRVVDRVDNAALRVGVVSKHKANPLWVQDKPWESRLEDLHPSIWLDPSDKTFKCFYGALLADPATAKIPRDQRQSNSYSPVSKNRLWGLCLALSKDGLSWTKPDLKINPWEGNPSNILHLDVAGSGVWMTAKPANPSERFRMLFKRKQQLNLAHSANGMEWSPPKPVEKIKAGLRHELFHASRENRFVGLSTIMTTRSQKPTSVIVRHETRDLKKWSTPTTVLRSAGDEDVQGMSIFYRRGVYLGLITLRNRKTDRVHCELAWSADTKKWQRIDPDTPLIAPSQNKGDHDWGGVYAARPLFAADHVRLYYGGSNGPHSSWRDGSLSMATLRLDGFAGYEPTQTEKPASVWTHPMQYDGRPWRITADAKGGMVRLVLFDATGRSELMRSEPVTTDVSGAEVKWPAGSNPKDLQGVAVRVKFEIQKAKVFAFGFRRSSL